MRMTVLAVAHNRSLIQLYRKKKYYTDLFAMFSSFLSSHNAESHQMLLIILLLTKLVSPMKGQNTKGGS